MIDGVATPAPEDQLEPEEHMLWEGRPVAHRFVLRGAWPSIPVVAGPILAALIARPLVTADGPPIALLVPALALAISAYILGGRYVVVLREATRMRYALTSHRVLIEGSAFGRRSLELDLAQVPAPRLATRADGIGSIYFGEPQTFEGWPLLSSAPGTRVPAFVAIERAPQVFRQVEDARAARTRSPEAMTQALPIKQDGGARSGAGARDASRRPTEDTEATLVDLSPVRTRLPSSAGLIVVAMGAVAVPFIVVAFAAKLAAPAIVIPVNSLHPELAATALPAPPVTGQAAELAPLAESTAPSTPAEAAPATHNAWASTGSSSTFADSDPGDAKVAITASRVMSNDPPANAFDRLADTRWNSGAFSPEWIEIDLGAASTITEIRLLVEQHPAGETVHQVIGWTPNRARQLIVELRGFTRNGQWLSHTPATPLEGIQYMRIATVSSPSWVAWREIQIVRSAERID